MNELLDIIRRYIAGEGVTGDQVRQAVTKVDRRLIEAINLELNDEFTRDYKDFWGYISHRSEVLKGIREERSNK
ncbi:MAG: hypothetical protein SNJ66_11195 [Chloroherpetonaceae bacterium]